MQDTEKFQDDLLQRIFPLGQSSSYALQRFGDSNQAIFYRSGMGDDNSFPDSHNQHLRHIIHSHRFGTQIGHLVQALAVDKGTKDEPHVCIGTENVIYNHKPILLPFEQGKEIEVLNSFIEVIKEKLPNENLEKLNVHATAANAKKVENALRLTSYFPNFNKKIKSKEFVQKSLYSALNSQKPTKQNELLPVDLHNLFEVVWKSLIYYLRCKEYQHVEDNKNQYYTVSTLQKSLQCYNCEGYKNLLHHFRVLIWHYINSFECKESWEKLNSCMKGIIEQASISVNMSDWLQYDDLPEETQIETSSISKSNVYKNNNIRVLINTIHGVKGQTHDVTLVMETKFYELDWYSAAQEMHLTNSLPAKHKRKRVHMRGLFVGCSRPKKLLCVAVTQKTAELLQEKFADLFEVYPPLTKITNVLPQPSKS